MGGSRPGASSAGAARSSRAESEGVPAVTDVSSSEATSSETSEYRSQRHRLATFGVGPAVAEAPQDGAGGAAREGDDGFASLDEQPGFFNPLAAKEARQWAAGARVYASMPGCAIADRPPGLPRDSVALRKSTDTWQGSFIMQCDPDAYAANPLGVEAELRARLGEVFVRVECWGLAAMDAALTPDAGRLALDDDPGAPPPPGLVMLGSKKEMERLCAVGASLAGGVARACCAPWSVLARSTDETDDEFGRELARLELGAFLEAQGLPLHRAAPLLEAPDLAVAKGLLAQLATDAQTTLGDLRVLLACSQRDGRLAVGLPRARAAKRREPAAHAAVRGAHEVLALRFGVLDDDVGLVTVQPHARCAVVDAASRPDVVFLRMLAVDDGSSPKRKLRSSSCEFVPKHFVAPSPPNSPARGPAAATPAHMRPPASPKLPDRRAANGKAATGNTAPGQFVPYTHPQRRNGAAARADDGEPAPNSADKGGYKKGNKNGYKKDYSKDKPKRVFKNKKSIPCCYFLRNLCENGDSCKFSHDASLTGLDTGCSWGKDCRYGHYYDPYAKDACEPCDAAVTAE